MKVSVTDVFGVEHNLTTDANGNYTVKVPVGDADILIDESTLPGGSTQTEGTNPTTVIAVLGSVVSDVDGFAPPAPPPPVLPILTIGDANETEGEDLVFEITLSEPSTTAVSVTITQTAGTAGTDDYVETDVNVTIPAGSTSVTVTVPSTDDNIDEGEEQFTIIATVTSGNTDNLDDTGTGTIIDNDHINVFDPPSATKVANAGGWPEIEWKMVWINDGNADAMKVHVEDPLSSDLTFVDGSLDCHARGASLTDAGATGCYYDTARRTVIWNGSIAADEGLSTEDTADNEVVIIFRTTVPASINAVENQALAFWDHNGDGIVETNESVNTDDPATALGGDTTEVIHPTCPSTCQSGCTSTCGGACPPKPPTPAVGDIKATDNLDVPITHYGVTSVDVLANGDNFGVNGACGSIVFTQPFNGTTSLDDGGTPNNPLDDMILYEPESNYQGSDTFEYTISDCAGLSDTATVTLDIDCSSTQRSDSGDALGKVSIIFMMILTGLIGLYYIRREELTKIENSKKEGELS